MKKLLALGLIAMLAACASEPKETYPYGMSEREWSELSIKDKARIRRDFYFYEKGSINFVDPQMEVEGKKEVYPNQNLRKPAPVKKEAPEVK